MVDVPRLDGLITDQGDYWSSCSLMGPGRDHNSDSLAIKVGEMRSSFVVADGVGAMPGSPLASAAAAGSASDWIVDRQELGIADVSRLMQHVDLAVKTALTTGDAAGATTIVALAVHKERALIISVGDSEAIAVHERGPAERVTPLDHLPNRPNVLTAWLDGKEPYTPHVIPIPTLPYRLCLMTDGVSGVLGDRDIAEIVRSVEPKDAAQKLVTAAREAGSTDDASCIVIASAIVREEKRGLLSKLVPFRRKRSPG